MPVRKKTKGLEEALQAIEGAMRTGVTELDLSVNGVLSLQ